MVQQSEEVAICEDRGAAAAGSPAEFAQLEDDGLRRSVGRLPRAGQWPWPPMRPLDNRLVHGLARPEAHPWSSLGNHVG